MKNKILSILLNFFCVYNEKKDYKEINTKYYN